MSGISLKELVSFRCRYHRNGVSGEGFDLCEFTWRERRGHAKKMRAIVFEGRGQCAVFTEDMHERFRGDLFEPHLRHLIENFPDKFRFCQPTPSDDGATLPSQRDGGSP